jgi:hypothetical protein
MVCASFNFFVGQGFFNKRWRSLPRLPSAEMTAHAQQLHRTQTALGRKGSVCKAGKNLRRPIMLQTVAMAHLPDVIAEVQNHFVINC